ncbi:hypothetical protein [Ilumatobacter coccineus]|uniref:Uncharacterized protein n=1 Tax=Ilumatobacter coccineus (strain NBRC 103263 / KCTC 29153 / YM16-304) TaxID=1313172 RepID=A0A6C7EAI9_ILUCY|nr:hypothetical protein [Ilumatobacter coccineus]BAN02229.1 hypothetical protein YM304_19150 [Ilumatobacter coccineus YM16-304]
MNEPQRSHDGGDIIVRANLVGTLAFVVTATIAAALFTTGVQWLGAVTAMTLFVGGIAAFIWSFWNAVQRSRGEQVAVTQLYMLAGGVAPPAVRKLMTSLLAVQIVTGLATAFARPNNSDGSPGTSLALGVLVPMFGLGMNGLWAAFHGTYAARPTDETRSSVTTSGGSIDKNEEHG